MERGQKRRPAKRYDRVTMTGERDPIDAEIRRRLAALDFKQKEVAAQIGRKPAWLSKYLSGQGHATIDELIRLLAVALEIHGLSEHERRLLKAWRRIPEYARLFAVEWFEDWVRRELRRARKSR